MYLAQNKYTEAKKIAIQGISNGGLLIGACINQRPDLFGAAIAQVGVLDMLRYDKFTIGFAWIPEFGNPQQLEHFENLIKFSPLHNVQSPTNESNQYPSTFTRLYKYSCRCYEIYKPLYLFRSNKTEFFLLKNNFISFILTRFLIIYSSELIASHHI